MLLVLVNLVDALREPQAKLVACLIERPAEEVVYKLKNWMPVPQGWCVMSDHYMTTFQVGIKNLRFIKAQTVKDQLQKENEGMIIDQTVAVCVVSNNLPK